MKTYIDPITGNLFRSHRGWNDWKIYVKGSQGWFNPEWVPMDFNDGADEVRDRLRAL